MRGHEYVELQAFTAVVEHGSFARAADHLRLAPSTLSQIIRNLEERLGVRLLNRTTRSVSVTAAGSRLLARFKPALEEMEAAISDARDLQAKPRGNVRLHIPRPAYTALLEPALGTFHRMLPDILLEVTIDDALTNIVATGFDLDVRSRTLIDRSLTAINLGADLRHVAVASPAYLEKHGRPATPQGLAHHRCIGWRAPGAAPPGPRPPCAASVLATAMAVRGPVVDRSTTVAARLPWASPSSPSTTCCTMSGVGRLVSTMSALSATSRALLQGLAPRCAAMARACSEVSNTCTVCPASRRRTTMGLPMRPRPTNPSSTGLLPSFGHCLPIFSQPSTEKR